MNNKQIFFAGCILYAVLFAVSCEEHNASSNTAEIHTSDLTEIKIVQLFSITDDAEKEHFFRHISHVATDSQHQIYLGDAHPEGPIIYVFNRNGEFVNTIGRRGSGPGEFQSLFRMFVDQQDRLFTIDVRQARNTIFREINNSWEVEGIFTIDGERYFIESVNTQNEIILRQPLRSPPEPELFWYEHELTTGHLESSLTHNTYYQFKDRGYLINNEGHMSQVPYGRETIVSSGPNGNLYLVWNEQFELAVFNTQLEIIDSLVVAIPNQLLSQQESDEFIEQVREELRPLVEKHMPNTKPAIRDMWIDPDENLWLHTYDDPEYLVLNRQGHPIGSFDLPQDSRLAHVDQQRIYTLHQGEKGFEVAVFEYDLNY